VVFTPNLGKKLENEIVLLFGEVSEGENSILLSNWANGHRVVRHKHSALPLLNE